MQTANSVFISRRFNCGISELFDWLVRPELIAKWFGPKFWSVGKVQTDLRVGGKYSIELTKPDNQDFFIEGEYLEIEAPHNIDFSLEYKGLSNTPPKSIVKIKLEEVAQDVSLLSLVQEFEHMPLDIKNRTKAWEHMMQKLSDLLRTSANQ